MTKRGCISSRIRAWYTHYLIPHVLFTYFSLFYGDLKILNSSLTAFSQEIKNNVVNLTTQTPCAQNHYVVELTTETLFGLNWHGNRIKDLSVHTDATFTTYLNTRICIWIYSKYIFSLVWNHLAFKHILSLWMGEYKQINKILYLKKNTSDTATGKQDYVESL